MKPGFKYIYGPVPSWRLGSSLGIDPISQDKKICSFDCVYCQLGETIFFSDERKVFVPVDAIIEELDLLPPVEVDYITFSGAGEPTLAENLGDMIKVVKKIRKDKVAVLTNSSLMYREDVQEDLLSADLVAVKLDACSQEVFGAINHPFEGISFDKSVCAIKKFKTIYKGKLALQVMFMEENKKYAKKLASIIREINPDEIQVNTPLRPCRVKSLPKEELNKIKKHFQGLNVVSVYEAQKKDIKPISNKDTLARRGKI
ncbi:MAG: radical SAM protein [Candidatus Omnitrophota bacterium]|jgi:wyosine [tRNA(Phe)-imidazoG37] synthetase (radical SAM superfamily)